MGGVLALLMRLQLASPKPGVMSADLYNQLFTMHGSNMMFLFAVPVMEAMGVYLVPLMVGTRNIAFPRLNAFSYWIYLVRRHPAVGGSLPPDGTRCRLVRLCAAVDARNTDAGKRADIWAQMITFTEVVGARGGGRDRRDRVQAACAGHVAQPHSAVRLGACWSRRSWSSFAMPAIMVAQHVADSRPAGRHAFLQPERRAATCCSGSTSSGSSATRRSTSSSCRRRAWSRRSSRPSRGGRCSAISALVLALIAIGFLAVRPLGASHVRDRPASARRELLHRLQHG